MTIDPEVIPSSSSAGNKAIRHIPRWAVFSGIGLGVFLFIGVLKSLLPLILMGLVLSFILNQAKNH